MKRYNIICTGPPGSGKTSVLAALSSQFSVVPESARRVLASQRASGGQGTGEQDSWLFVELMLKLALSDAENAGEGKEVVLFDRGIPDLLAFSKLYGRDSADILDALNHVEYAATVFWFAAWKEIYTQDEERRMSFSEAAAFGELLFDAYQTCGFELISVPCGPVDMRAAFIRGQVTDLLSASKRPK